MLITVELYNPFDVIFLVFWGAGDTPDWDGYCKILIYLDCRPGFGLVSASVMKEITSKQVIQWAFVTLFSPFGLPRMIVVDSDGIFSWVFKKPSQ